MNYLIELERWGIIPGIPNKPYKLEDYITANNNILGINNALIWAQENNYNHVTFPRNDYSICYPNPIITQENTIVDFNFSTLKVIYDSDIRSPLDSSGNTIYEFKGDSILCKSKNTHMINLNLIGDRIDRSWKSHEERSIEHTNGIKLGVGADNCSIKGCNISYYMADAIALYYSPYEHFPVENTEFGTINYNNGQLTNSDKIVRTINFIPISSDVKKFSMIGLGYNPTTTIPKQKYDVFFYKADNTFISSKKNIRTRDAVQIPKNAVKLKLAWEGNGTVDDNCVVNGNPPYWAILVKNGIADNIIIENNEIHRNHRGGIFLGTNNVTIRNNYFHDTGYQGDYDLDGLPTFTDFTRYAINTEDNVGQNCKIVNNVFENTRMAIALRGDYNEISGNEFRNCEYGVILYYLKHCLVEKNFFYHSNLGCYEYENFNRDWRIDNNIFDGGNIILSGSGAISSISNNSFYNSSCSSYIHLLNFKNNIFNNSIYIIEESDTIIDGCSFVNQSIIKAINKPYPINNIIRCKFINSVIHGQNIKKIVIKDSYFKESNYNYSTGETTYTLINCNIDNKQTNIIKSSSPIDIGIVKNNLELIECNITLGNNAIIYSMGWDSLIIKDTNIKYILTKNLTKAFIDFYGNIEKKIEITNSSLIAENFIASQSVQNTLELILNNHTLSNVILN